MASAASTCPSSCPWGLIPQHQFVLEEDRGLAFIHPSAAPNSNRSDLLSVWHLTPLSLQPCWFTCATHNPVSKQTMIHLWGNFLPGLVHSSVFGRQDKTTTHCYIKQTPLFVCYTRFNLYTQHIFAIYTMKVFYIPTISTKSTGKQVIVELTPQYIWQVFFNYKYSHAHMYFQIAFGHFNHTSLLNGP